MSESPAVDALPPLAATSIFAAMGAVLFLSTNMLIPWLAEETGFEIVLFWFLVGAGAVFIPLLVIARFMLAGEGRKLDRDTWTGRLRFRRLQGKDLLWTAGALLVIGALSVGMMRLVELLVGEVNTQPGWMQVEPLSGSRLWLLAAWLPFWLSNIMGEEILWRGVMLPRQEIASGSSAWFVHGIGWILFHLAFGWQLLLTMLPILLILPFVVQRRGNSWIGVIVHAGLNGPAFLAISLGLL